jgi:hypothetical protein
MYKQGRNQLRSYTEGCTQPNTSDIARVDMLKIPISVYKTRALLKFEAKTNDPSLENYNYRSIDIIISLEFSKTTQYQICW